VSTRSGLASPGALGRPLGAHHLLEGYHLHHPGAARQARSCIVAAGDGYNLIFDNVTVRRGDDPARKTAPRSGGSSCDGIGPQDQFTCFCGVPRTATLLWSFLTLLLMRLMHDWPDRFFVPSGMLV
jgi:hypothetical protein